MREAGAVALRVVVRFHIARGAAQVAAREPEPPEPVGLALAVRRVSIGGVVLLERVPYRNSSTFRTTSGLQPNSFSISNIDEEVNIGGNKPKQQETDSPSNATGTTQCAT
jgi:hypothetical protein